jgi:hypothetical protein
MQQPAPDRTINDTWWVSLFGGLLGLDHFYLRSPWTGVAKMLTLGGLGLWWLTDVLQLTFDKEKVARYGLIAPFFATAGVGQGVLTDKTTYVRQRTDYFGWVFMALMDVIGLTALLEGRPGAFLRRLVDFVLMIAFAATGNIVGYMFALIFGFFTLVPAFFTIRGILYPESLAKTGIAIPESLKKLLNFFEAWTGIIGTNATAVVTYDIGLKSVQGKAAKDAFSFVNKKVLEEEQAEGGAESTPPQKELISWPSSLLLGSVFGGMVLGIVNFFTWLPSVKLALFAADGYFGAVRLSRGETPDIPDIGGFLPPGMGSLASGAVGGLAKSALKSAADGKSPLNVVTDVAGKAVSDATGGLNPLKAVTDIAGGANPLSKAVSEATSGLKAVTDIAGGAQNLLKAATPILQQSGGARNEDLSTEALVLGTTVIALIAGGAIKVAVDSLVGN